ncbi:MAG: isoprenylcysteine carboxylmethyltransferase family protein [Planctomycetota bacterium]
MNVDESLRWILVAGLVTILPVAIYYRLRSQASGERLNRRPEGWFFLLTIRPIGLVYALAVMAFSIDPSWMSWCQFRIPALLRWCGVPFFFVALALLVGVFRTLGDNLTDTVVTRQQHELVTRGPYRFIRHPLYTGTLLSAIGVGLITANGLVASSGIIAFGLLLLRSRKEERFLVERFGERYVNYRNRTGAVFPSLGQFRVDSKRVDDFD